MNTLFKNDINLDRDNHIYKLDQNPNLDFTSVTTFIGEFFEEFDAQKIANNLVKNNIKYMHLSAEELMMQWRESADYGTIVHEEIENFILNGIQAMEPKSIQGIDWLKKYRIKSDFDVYSEVVVYSKELQIAGTIDLLLYDKKTNMYNIMDWKTSKRISSKAYKNKKGNHQTTSNLDDCNFNHYALQLSLYRYILETYYQLNISEHMIIHLLENDCIGYHTPYMKNHISSMLEYNKIGD
tara:strand:+ start:300 stop:1016 length:717 start_codon:yes stop_codon:yes gene_type:complete